MVVLLQICFNHAFSYKLGAPCRHSSLLGRYALILWILYGKTTNMRRTQPVARFHIPKHTQFQNLKELQNSGCTGSKFGIISREPLQDNHIQNIHSKIYISSQKKLLQVYPKGGINCVRTFSFPGLITKEILLELNFIIVHYVVIVI